MRCQSQKKTGLKDKPGSKGETKVDNRPDLSQETYEGPSAALAFDKNFRGRSRRQSKPVDPDCCENLYELDKGMWSKEHVLADFRANRFPEQIGAIVFVKTEFCCRGSRLCAATTAAFEKKATPLVGRFRVYMAWIKANPEHKGSHWRQWEQKVISEYKFKQGPGPRIVIMVPAADGKVAEWSSNASALRLTSTNLQRSSGQTPRLEKFLRTAIAKATTAEK